MKTFYIYGLVDPRKPSVAIYVGCTVNPKKRLRHHISTAKTRLNNTSKDNAIRALGLRPEMVILEEFTGTLKQAHARERYWRL